MWNDECNNYCKNVELKYIIIFGIKLVYINYYKINRKEWIKIIEINRNFFLFVVKIFFIIFYKKWIKENNFLFFKMVCFFINDMK